MVVGSCGILEWCSGIPTKALEFSSSKLLILKELCCFPEIKRKKTSISKKLKLKYSHGGFGNIVLGVQENETNENNILSVFFRFIKKNNFQGSLGVRTIQFTYAL